MCPAGFQMACCAPHPTLLAVVGISNGMAATLNPEQHDALSGQRSSTRCCLCFASAAGTRVAHHCCVNITLVGVCGVLLQASESEARVRGMRLHDKALLAGSRLIAGSKLARAAIALYVLLLHGIIMALIYHSATPHVVLAGAAGSSSTPSAVAVAQGAARASGDLAGAAVDGLQRAAAANANANAASRAGGGGARLLLQAFAMRPLPLW
jgi:hypothetical protein